MSIERSLLLGFTTKTYNEMKEDLSLVHTSNSVGDFSPGKCDRTNDMQKTRIVYF